MLTATLITNPETPVLSTRIARSVCTRMSGRAITWLAKNIACDIAGVDDQNWEEIWAELQGQGIDMVIQNSDQRRRKILLADMDSTMIEQECIDELAAEAGVGEHVARITAQAMNGELNFEEALHKRVGLLKDLEVPVIKQVLDKRITLMPGGPTLVATHKANGGYAALVSGGFTDFTTAIAARLGFDENRANRLLSKDGRLTGKVGLPVLGKEAKVQALQEISSKLGLQYSDVLAVGDGANDLGMLHLAGSGVALHAKPIVAAQCKLRLNFADLTGLLYVQGFHREQFC